VGHPGQVHGLRGADGTLHLPYFTQFVDRSTTDFVAFDILMSVANHVCWIALLSIPDRLYLSVAAHDLTSPGLCIFKGLSDPFQKYFVREINRS